MAKKRKNYNVVRDGQGDILQDSSMFRPRSPQQSDILSDVSQGFTSIVQIARDVLINPDIAYRTNRQQSEQMLRDPMIASPLSKRMLATAQLDWQVVPEDPNDDKQVAIAQEIDRIIRNIPDLVNLFRYLLMGIFRGTGVAEVNWTWDGQHRLWCIDKARPHNGDKITYDIYGNPRLLTRQFQMGGRELDKGERDRMLIYTFDPDDGSFYEGAEAAYVYKGRGLRDTIWWYWFLKHNAVKFWVNFLQRYGGGAAIGRYPQGNATAKAAIESVLQNLVNDSMVSMPVPMDAQDRETYGIEFLKMEGLSDSAGVFKTFVEDWAGKHIRHLIEGQEQTFQESGDGLGSGRAKAMQDIFRMYRDYDATTLAGGCLTNQLVERIQWFNWGDLPFECRFEFILDQDDYDQQEKRVKAAKELGLKVPAEWAYEELGIKKPEPDEEILDFGAMANPLGTGGDDPLFDGESDPLFDESDRVNHAQAFRMRRRFAETIRG